MKKRILAIVLASLLCMSACSLSCFAADGVSCDCFECSDSTCDCICCNCHEGCCCCCECENALPVEDGVVREDEPVTTETVSAVVVGDYEFTTNFATTKVTFGILSSGYTADTVTLRIKYDPTVFSFVSARASLKVDAYESASYTSDTTTGVIIFTFPAVNGQTNAYSLLGTVTINFTTLKSSAASTVTLSGTGNHLAVDSEEIENPAYTILLNSAAVVQFCTHPYTYTVIEKESTCATKGVKKTYCSTCFKLLSTEELPLADHTLPENPVKVKAATCTATGTAEYVCTVCGKTVEKTLPMIAHTFGARYKDDDGIWYQRCTVCGTIVRSAIQCEHDASDYVLLYTLKDPTCTTLGSGVYKCSQCGAQTTMDIPMTSHQYEFTRTIVASTMTTEGSALWTCKVCGATEVRTTPKLSDHTEHVYTGREVIVTAATCTSAGLKNVYCAVEGCTSYLPVVIPALGHTWTVNSGTDNNGWVVTTNATCTTDGVKTRVCSVCGATETQTIPATGHTWTVNSSTDKDGWTTVKYPSCVEDGSKTRVCSVCGEIETEVLPKSNAYCVYPEDGYVVTKAATCISEGVLTCTCSVCGNTTKTRTLAIDPEAHSWSEWTVISDATCITTGERTRTCSLCGKTETETVPAVGHVYTNVVEKNGVTTRTCSVCHTKEVITVTKNGTSKAATNGDFTLVFGDTATAEKDVFFTINQVGIEKFNTISAFNSELQKYYKNQGFSDEKAANVTVESAFEYMLKIAGSNATVSSASQLVITLDDEYNKTSFDIWYLNENGELNRVSPSNVSRKGTTITVDIGSGTFKYPSDTIVLVSTGAKTTNYAVPITVAVLTLVVAAGVVFFVISKNRKVSF